MFRHWGMVLGIITAVSLSGSMAGNAAAQSEKSTGAVSPTPDAEKSESETKLIAATDAAKQLLLAMDTDQSGKVSKQEWMRFMEEEFDRLDTDRKGQRTSKS
jgi:EF hand